MWTCFKVYYIRSSNKHGRGSTTWGPKDRNWRLLRFIYANTRHWRRKFNHRDEGEDESKFGWKICSNMDMGRKALPEICHSLVKYRTEAERYEKWNVSSNLNPRPSMRLAAEKSQWASRPKPDTFYCRFTVVELNFFGERLGRQIYLNWHLSLFLWPFWNWVGFNQWRQKLRKARKRIIVFTPWQYGIAS